MMPDRDNMSQEEVLQFAVRRSREMLVSVEKMHAIFSEGYRSRHEQGAARDVEHEVHAQLCLLLEQLREHVEEVERAVADAQPALLIGGMDGVFDVTEEMKLQYARLVS